MVILLDRLTLRARNLLNSLPKKKKVISASIIKSIIKSEGMGKHFVDAVAGIDIHKRKLIDVDQLVKEAYYQSVKFEHPYVGTEHILLALLKIMDSGDLNKVKLETIKANIFPYNLKNYQEKGRKTPLLDTFASNINQKIIKQLDRPLVMRKEYNSMISALMLKSSSNVLLTGDSGVGKKTLIDLLARNIISLDVPPNLAGYQIYEFDLLSFITNQLNKGGLEYGLTSFVDELKSVGRVILSIKNFQNIFVSSPGGFTLPMFYSMFKSTMESSDVQVVATMNNSLFDRISGDNEHLLDDFTIIEVEEPGEAETLKMLEISSGYLSDFHNVEIPKEVVKTVYKRSKDLIMDVKFPQKGIDLMDHACAQLIMKRSRIPESYKKLMDKSFDLLNNLDDDVEKGNYDQAVLYRDELKQLERKLAHKEEKIFMGTKLTLTIDDIDTALLSFDTDGKKKFDPSQVNINKLINLSEKIKNRIIGQDAVVDIVVRGLIRAEMGLRSKKRPLGNFLFLGPTGVGKTELAKILADEFFGERALIRLDMSDFGEKHNVARLVGAPPGYVGYGEGGELTTKIESKPNSVVLFDEIEKAHPDVLNILLQIMEEGELTDAKGVTYDFGKAVIVLTSNLGTQILHNQEIGFENKDMENDRISLRLMNNLKKILKPELLNRFDEILVFRQLSQEDQNRIINLLLQEIQTTLLNQKIRLEITEEVVKYLLEIGYSKEFGARALRRQIEKELLDRVAEYLISTKDRPLTLQSKLTDGKIVIVNKSRQGRKAQKSL